MNTLILAYLLIFLLLCLSVFVFFRLDIVLKQRSDAKKAKRRKIKQLKKQNKLQQSIRKIREKQENILNDSNVSKPIYYTLCGICSVFGFFVGKIIYSSLLVSVAVGCFSFFAPLLFFSYKQTKSLTARLNHLASSMMIVSNSYIVTEDIITSIHDNIDKLEYPDPFREFLTYVKLIDTDVKAGLRRMEDKVGNPYFSQWIDALVLAQDDRTLKYVAVSVVESMHDMLQVQRDSDTAMFSVWRDYFMVLILIFSVPLIFRVLLHVVYLILTTSLIGQVFFLLLLAAVVYSVIRALKINRPLMI